MVFFLLSIIYEEVRRKYKNFPVNLGTASFYCSMSITDVYLELQYMKWMFYFESVGLSYASSMTQSRSGLVFAS